jgi:predicted ATPase
MGQSDMLTQIKIQNFKCFDNLLLPLGRLTMLSGFNAAGKSTALQSLLLLTQALRSTIVTPELPLNGPIVRLGTPGEVLNSGIGNIIFGIEDEQTSIEWEMQAEDRAKGNAFQILRIELRNKDGRKKYERNSLSCLLSFLPQGSDETAIQLVNGVRDIIFLSAVRIGTADVFPSPDDPSPVHADVGKEGQYAPWWFQRLSYDDVDESRRQISEEATTLRRQFNAWANQLFPKAQATATILERTNLVRLELRIGDIGDYRRPSNIGYGLTYAFPVIVAGLLAKKDQILIIDSPEAHLHPMGQSQMGRFLAQVAAAGVQVIIETHSDHVLNGIRLAVRDNIINSDKVALHFFNHGGAVNDDISRVTSPLIDRLGNLSEWPVGFFDQSEKDLSQLAGWD